MGSITLQVIAADESKRPVLEAEIREQTRESLKRRIQSQTGFFSRLAGGRLGEGLLAKLLDRNGDGSLQADEVAGCAPGLSLRCRIRFVKNLVFNRPSLSIARLFSGKQCSSTPTCPFQHWESSFHLSALFP